MSNLRRLLLVLCTLLSLGVFAQTGEEYAQEAERATRLLDKAVAHYKANGESAFAAFSRQGVFVDGELYVYVVDTSGVMLASGGPSANLVGRDISSVLGDELNKTFKEALSLPETGETHSAEYRWMNWADGKTQRKRVFFQRVGERIFAVGYYMPRSSQTEALALLERATAAVAAAPVEAIGRINGLSPEFVQDDLYVFVVDLGSEKFVAHGYNLRLVGTDFRSLLAADRQPIGRQMLDILKSGGEGEVHYQWRNPANNRVEQKSTLIRKVGGYTVAVGHYQRPGS